ncbi:MAG: hypothetical protein PHF81_12290 [Flavobacterium sp.]|nr:hypothetical protein [Flavobacterium sp.]
MQEKSIIKQNILRYLDFIGVTQYKFHQKTGITRGVLVQNNGMSEENTARFLAHYEDVNVEWLLTGKGEMLKNGAEKQPEPSNFREQLDDKNALLKIYREKIQDLEKENAKLKKEKAASEYNLHVAEPREELKNEPKK